MPRASVIVLWAALAALPRPSSAQTSGPISLAGLPGVRVIVGRITPDDPAAPGLDTATIRTDVELRLRQSRVPVFDQDQWLRVAGKPFLYVHVYVLQLNSLTWAYTLRLSLTQVVTLDRNPTIRMPATTWGTQGTFGYGPSSNIAAVVRGGIRDMVDSFLNAYLAANP